MAPKQKRINSQIRESHVVVFTENGENLWTLTLEEALEKAEHAELDLVEVWMQWDLVLCKMMDYGKFLFKQQKNQSNWKTSSKKADVKTLKITYKIWDHDLEIRRKQAEKFAKDGHPLKVMLTLRWRENHFVWIAEAKMKEFITSLSEFYKTSEQKLVKTGNNFSILLYPKQ